MHSSAREFRQKVERSKAEEKEHLVVKSLELAQSRMHSSARELQSARYHLRDEVRRRKLEIERLRFDGADEEWIQGAQKRLDEVHQQVQDIKEIEREIRNDVKIIRDIYLEKNNRLLSRADECHYDQPLTEETKNAIAEMNQQVR